ncbi:peptidyl-prolyl cis-trans isomerase [Winogradskyella vincentii]|uniref:Peptidyl-prolyl cis-trans isomerase n=1 Tax=Winogradskyella vincentii TaxID=2877122 RepID=A0ABS7Y201_9FLAO|nr:peptidyl-prolyl cis-trans isomerase [Winogradskyella vincentii]MCA0153285.1 peptidyl-prolyl cis-trans isomerase [Winogradskyella vincentii]
MKHFSLIIIVLFLFVGCDFFKKADEEGAVARVNDVYLYKDDIKDLVPEGASSADSVLIVNQYINRWASQLLLMDGAMLNLNESKQQSFTKLVDQYKTDLYTKAYLDALVKKNIDTVVPRREAEVFYEANKESFKLNDDLLQLRYLSLPQNPIDLDTITKRFKRFNNDDKRYLDSISVQFKAYSLNDSMWVKYSQVADKVPVVNSENKNQLLKKSNFIQLKDSINLYLMQVKDVRIQNDYAPLEYVSSSIEQIVINKRKLELIKQLEKDITKDAIKNKQFEIYE